MRGIVDVVAMVVVVNGMDDEYDEYNNAAMTSRQRTMGRTRDAAVGWRGGGMAAATRGREGPRRRVVERVRRQRKNGRRRRRDDAAAAPERQHRFG